MTASFRADLHMHSNRSDGVLSPETLVQEAKQCGISLMALTDHDCFDGCEELLAGEPSVALIPGVELSLKDLSGLHLLGYGFRRDTKLHHTVRQLADKRKNRAMEMLNRLEEMGMPLSWRELEKRCAGSVGRPHIARAMVHAGYVPSMKEAFDRFLGHGKPAYVAGERLDMSIALSLMRRSGFVPVLAHPYELQLEQPIRLSLIEKWQDQGLMGVEVYHPSARSYGFAELDRFARQRGLLVTGGSDFHQANDKHGSIGCMCEDWLTVREDVAALQRALEHAA